MKRKTVALILGLAAMTGVASAVNYDWLSGAGNWTDAGWTTNGVAVTPAWGSADSGIIHSGTMNVTPTANPGTQINEVLVQPGAGSASMNISGDLSTALSVRIASSSSDSGSVTVTQTGGTVSSVGTTFVGQYGSGTSTYNLSGGTLSSGNRLYIGANDSATGTFNVNGGIADVASHFYLGAEGDGNTTGTLNLSSGALLVAGTSYAGVRGTATWNQTGGTFEGYRLHVGHYDTSDGFVSISGGSFETTGYIYGRAGESVFEVDGSGATEIEVNAVIFNNATDTLRFNLDAAGSTLMTASGDYGGLGIDLENCNIEVDTIAGFDGTLGSTYDLMWTATGYDTTGVTLSSLGTTEFDWNIVAKDGGEVFQVTVIPEPATLGLIGFAGMGMLWFRRKFFV